MENVAHTLTGLALARAGLGRTTPLATSALVLGANLPDIDLLWSLGGELAYLDLHRGWTHSLLGGAVGTVALWATLLGIGWHRRWGEVRAGSLLLASAAGVWSHILLDASNSYGLRPFLPWDGRWVYGDVWHIVDPWLWLLLGTAVFISGRGGRARAGAWIAAASGITLIVVVLPIPIVAPGTRVAWAIGLAIALALALRGAGARGATFAPRIALAAVVVYATGCAILHAAAVARLDALSPGEGATRAAIPRFGDPVRWDGLIADRRTVRYRIVGSLAALDSPASGQRVLPRNLDDPRVLQLLDSCAGEVIGDFFRYPFAVIDVDPSGNGRVAVRDARYSRDSDGFASVTVPLALGVPDLRALACP